MSNVGENFVDDCGVGELQRDRFEGGTIAVRILRTGILKNLTMTTRRIVTALDKDGKSFFLHDGPTPGILDLGRAVDEEIWIDDPGRPDLDNRFDPAAAEKFDLEPPLGGSRIRVFTFMPDKFMSEKGQLYDPEQLAATAQRFNTGKAMDPNNPGMHTTATIDYGIVLSGKISLELDSGTVALESGDIVVQRATPHAWRNVSDEPCSMLFVLIASDNYNAS